MRSAKRMKYGYSVNCAAEQALFAARSPLSKMLAAVSAAWLILSLLSAYILVTNIGIYRAGAFLTYLRLIADPCLINIMYLMTPLNITLAIITAVVAVLGVTGHMLVAVGKYRAVAVGLCLGIIVDIAYIAVTPAALLLLTYLNMAILSMGDGLLLLAALLVSCLVLAAIAYVIVTLVRIIMLRVQLAGAVLKKGARNVRVYSSPPRLLRICTVLRVITVLFNIYMFLFAVEYHLPLAFMLVSLALGMLSIMRLIIKSVLLERFSTEAYPLNSLLFTQNNSIAAIPSRVDDEAGI